MDRDNRERDPDPLAVTLDLAVVGAGAAGTYVAYHMAAIKPDWSIALFERTDRVGGRLLTLPSGIGHASVELGGMRFRTGHRRVAGMVNDLGLPTRPFNTAHPDNRYFLRGRSSRTSEGVPPGSYDVDSAEVGLKPEDLLLRAFEAVVPGALALTEADWLRVGREKQFQGRPLRDWTLTEVYRASMSEEAMRLLLATLGYMSGVGPHNAADGIPYVLDEIVGIDDQLTIADGMAALPQEVARRFEARGGRVFLDHQLDGFAVVGAGDAKELELAFSNGQSMRARRLVLALPRPAVDALAVDSPFLRQPAVSGLVDATTGYPALKLYLWYDEPWWREDGFSGRRVTTDLPLRKTFYLDSSEAADTPGQALLLAAFADGTDLDAWQSLPALAGTSANASHAAPEALVSEAEGHLRQMHGMKVLPTPVGSGYRYWGADSRQTAWHFWRAGVASADVKRRIAQPDQATPVYLCGEAWSTAQAWIEGALEGADAVIDRLAG